MTSAPQPIVLTEYIPARIPAGRISQLAGKRLWQEFGEKITIAAPSFKNDGHWELTSQGWVGFIPFSETLSFHLKPKIPLKNLFGMWEYAYRLKSFQFPPGLFQCDTLQEFYEQLASTLAKLVLDRGRKGYYRAYVSRTEQLAYLRGKLDLRYLMDKPWESRPRCHYQENTADVKENQILAWTLYAILRSGFCTERVLPIMQKSYRHISQTAALQPFKPQDCLEVSYNRLNQDYRPMHALCRFFLENSGPSYHVGERLMLPFLVNMAGLFELFVAEWLRKNLPPEYELIAQERIQIDTGGDIFFKIDLVIYEASTKQPIWVLDTKYKNATSPSNDDIAQIVFYALAKKCRTAILVYPTPLARPMNETIDNINIRTATFSLDGDLEVAGQNFLAALIKQHKDSIQ